MRKQRRRCAIGGRRREESRDLPLSPNHRKTYKRNESKKKKKISSLHISLVINIYFLFCRTNSVRDLIFCLILYIFNYGRVGKCIMRKSKRYLPAAPQPCKKKKEKEKERFGKGWVASVCIRLPNNRRWFECHTMAFPVRAQS
jgi:hypothetical protein